MLFAREVPELCVQVNLFALWGHHLPNTMLLAPPSLPSLSSLLVIGGPWLTRIDPLRRSVSPGMITIGSGVRNAEAVQVA